MVMFTQNVRGKVAKAENEGKATSNDFVISNRIDGRHRGQHDFRRALKY